MSRPEPLLQLHPFWNRHRALSALLALFYAVMSVAFGGIIGTVELFFLFLLLPLACIWFPEFFVKRPSIMLLYMGAHSSPGSVRAVGWVGMSLPLVVVSLLLLMA